MKRITRRQHDLGTGLMGLTLSAAVCSLVIGLSGCGGTEEPVQQPAKQTEPTPDGPAMATNATENAPAAKQGAPEPVVPSQPFTASPVAQFGLPDQGDNPVITIDHTRKPASIMQMSKRRAYLGAPPVIPHSIMDQTSSSDCMVCHHKGLNSGQLVTPPIPHPYLTNCTQCHVELKATNAMASFLSDNTFDGLEIPMSGTRAWEGAPPTIPHPLWMRDNCLSCHGETARPGLETTHPWRQSCTQCHVIQPGMAQQP